MPLQIVRQDITKMCVDAVVNSTNENMIGYSGVDLAIHRAAGSKLGEECAKISPLALGEAKLTGAYELKAKYIIHTSGPIWKGGMQGESVILSSCYLEALKLAVQKDCNSIAFPLISSGAYGYPKDKVLKFAIQVITEFLNDHELMVYLCVYDRSSYEFSRALYNEINEYITDDYVEHSARMEAPRCFASRVLPERELCQPKMSMPMMAMAPCEEKGSLESLEDYIKNMDKSFAYKLFDYIDERGMTDVECYKKANVDKKTFSKIKCNPGTYKPSKQTAIAFAIALHLDIEETQDLLSSAGLTLSQSFTFDKIIRYFIEKKIYDIFEINEALFEFDQMLLGC